MADLTVRVFGRMPLSNTRKVVHFVSGSIRLSSLYPMNSQFVQRIIARFILVAFVSTLTSGCLSPVQRDGRLKHQQFKVQASSLDWLEIGYFPHPKSPDILAPCRLSLFGTGEIQFKTGRSPQVWSAFSHEVQHPFWNEVFSDRLHLPSHEIQAVFQEFVDEGVVPPRTALAHKTTRQKVTPPYIQVAGTIGRHKIRLATDNAFLVELVEAALANFESTILRSADTIRKNPAPSTTP